MVIIMKYVCFKNRRRWRKVQRTRSISRILLVATVKLSTRTRFPTLLPVRPETQPRPFVEITNCDHVFQSVCVHVFVFLIRFRTKLNEYAFNFFLRMRTALWKFMVWIWKRFWKLQSLKYYTTHNRLDRFDGMHYCVLLVHVRNFIETIDLTWPF